MFDKRFQIVLADTEKSKQIHFQLRCEIYCIDRSFESLDECTDRMEMDEADKRSIHFLIQEKDTLEWIGTFRVVLPDHDKLPIEKYCDMKKEVMENLSRESLVEVSRLGIVRRYTQRAEGIDKNSVHLTAIKNSHSAVSNLREITNGICRVLWQFSVENGNENILFFITPALARILLGMKIPLLKAGSPCKHRGTRYPYIIQLEELSRVLTIITHREDNDFMARNGYYLYSEFSENKVPSELNFSVLS